MESQKFTGIVEVLNDIETIPTKSGQDFSKRDIVVTATEATDQGVFVNPLKFQATGKAIAKLNDVSLKDKVEVSYNTKGTKWTNKEGKVVYFVNLNLWDVNVLDKSGNTSSSQANTQPQNIGSDDLPF